MDISHNTSAFEKPEIELFPGCNSPGEAGATAFFDLHNGDDPLRDEAGLEVIDRSDIVGEMSRIFLDVAGDELPAADRAVFSVTVGSVHLPVSVTALTFVNGRLDRPQASAPLEL